MKTGRKTLSILLALMLVLCLTVTAFATSTTYTIEVNNASDGNTYKAYKIFDIEEATSGTYVYSIKTTDTWYSAVKTYAEGADSGMTLTTDSSDNSGTKMIVTVDEQVFDAYTFANTLKTTAATVTADGTGTTTTANGVTTATISNLSSPGYYLVTSSKSSTVMLCYLDTVSSSSTNRTTVFEKSASPTVNKYVQQQDNSAAYDTTAAWDISGTIPFEIVINTGTEGGLDSDITITDTLPKGLTYDTNTGLTVYVGDVASGSWTADNGSTTSDYSVSVSGQIITVVLHSTKLSTLNPGTEIVISYSATFTKDSSGNYTQSMDYDYTNTVDLTYKNNPWTSSATVKTFDIGAGFTKVDKVKQTPLGGADFILSKVEDNKTYYAVAENGYLKEWTTDSTKATTLTSDNNTGEISLKGIGAGNYTLTETAAPSGYNLLDTPQIDVQVTTDGVTYKYANQEGYEDSIRVENATGSVLPSTGGIGTTIFYVVGGLMVFGAAVLLITKKRMSAYEE